MFHSCKKEDLRYVATELGETVNEKATVVQIVEIIKNNDYYKDDIEFVKSLINSTVEERKAEEQRQLTLEKTKLERVQAELELARLRAEPPASQNQSESEFEVQTSLDSLVRSVRTLTVKVPSRPEGWTFFFSSVERAFTAKNVPDGYKAEILLNLLGEKAANVLTYIKDEELKDYEKLKTLVLREFEPTPQSWLDNFRKTTRQPNESYMQFVSRLITSWDYYLKLRKVSDFKVLNELIVADKLFQTLEKDVAHHISVRQADEWFRPTDLAREIDLFYTASGKTPKNNSVSHHRHSNEKSVQKVFLSDVKNSKCCLCPSSHPLYKCSSYKELPVSNRVETVKTHRLCFNCLSATHAVRSCKSISCFCGKRHHQSLHFDKRGEQEKTSPRENQSPPRPFNPTADIIADPPRRSPDPACVENEGERQFSATSYCRNLKTVLLSTAVCFIRDEFENLRPVKCLLDQGSTSCFLTKDCVNKLGLKKKKVNITISGINDASFTVRERASASISNKDNSFVKELDFLIVPKITEDFIPSRKIEVNFESFSNINLADENFNVPENIEMLLGAEVFYELLKPEQIHLNIKNSNLVLQNSVFGFIASGSVSSDKVSKLHCGLIKTSDDLEGIIKKFWEIEEIEAELPKNRESEICEEHYARTYRREQTGTYTVTMPLKEDPTCLGDSKETALKRLNSLWRRLSREPEYSSLYRSFLKEYEEMGHMKEVEEEKEPMTAYYMPHHGVYRPLKTTTKLRVVFNGSCPTSKGNSLNSIQYNGGVIQEDIFSLMVRFRKHIYAFTADVEKMYRMIHIAPEQRKLQRILWKEDADKPVKIYELATVTYGTVSAPYLAMRTLKQLALDEYEKFPLAAPVVMSDIYMDDIVSGSETLSGAKELQRQLTEIFKSGGMNLHKWCSNRSELNNSDSDYAFLNDEEVKTLGVCWNPRKDNFLFQVKIEPVTVHTKRTVLSTIARVFDPLGLLGPAITAAKIFMQRLWLFKIDWDTPLPIESQREWEKFTNSLQAINVLEIERCLIIEESVHIELHGFADSSEAAYGAVIYAKSLNSKGEVKIKMITSKSRVAPLKKITIPRLELSAAVLLVKLMRVVQTALKLSVNLTYFWSDSMIVLAWLNKEPHQLKTFVANRVTKIQEMSSVQQWRHVPSEQNPADLVSRGLEPEKLMHCELWWNGPKFLLSNEYPSKDIPVNVISRDFPNELKNLNEDSIRKTLTCTNSSFLTDFLSSSNSYFKIVRIFSFIFRFLNNCKTQEKVSGPLTTVEIEAAEKELVGKANSERSLLW